jgi:hypothetical protein
MKRVKAYLILITGVLGVIIMPTDSLLQAVIGLAMFGASVWAGTHNWRAVYRELSKVDLWMKKNLLWYRESDSDSKTKSKI